MRLPGSPALRGPKSPVVARARRRSNAASLFLLPPLVAGLVLIGAHGALFADTQANSLPPDAIQPGAKIVRGTLGFFFYSLDEANEHGQPLIYAVTHGHGSMENQTGSPVVLADGRIPIGVVVAQEKDHYNDWSLIQIDEAYRNHVSTAVRGWTGPTSTPQAGDHQNGDTLCLIGYGTDRADDLYDHRRCGELQDTYTRSNVTGFRYTAMTWRGDSGSPILHYETGQALGIHLGRHTDGFARAIDTCSLLTRFAEHGYHLVLATAPYDPPRAHVAVHAEIGGKLDTPCFRLD
jgi:hypothetical protein